MSDTPKVSLPPVEFSFELSCSGEDTNQKFEGRFVYRRLTIGKKAEVNIAYNRLKQSTESVSEIIDNVLYMSAYLKFGLIESPDWWKESNSGLDLFDSAPVMELFLKVQEFEKSWHEQVFGKLEDEKKPK